MLFRSHYTGLPCDARSITEAVLKMEASAEYPEMLLVVRAEPPKKRVTTSAVQTIARGAED